MDEPRTPHDQPPLSTPAFQQPTAVSSSPDEAGHVMGIIGLVLAFTGLQLIGLILSIIGFVKSKHAGVQNTPALVGIILNGLIVLAVTLVAAFFIFLVANNYDDLTNGVTLQQASSLDEKVSDETVAGEIAAREVLFRSNAYHKINGIYPLTLNDYEHDTETSLKRLDDVLISTQPLTVKSAYQTRAMSADDTIVSRLELYACGATEGNKVGYWDTTKNKVVYVYGGLAGINSTCALMK